MPASPFRVWLSAVPPAVPPAGLRTAVLTLAVLAGTACTTVLPLPGQTAAEVVAAWGPAGARHALAGGGERLEYANGPAGRETWMIDLDASGRVKQVRQVLQEASFLAFQSAAAAGMDGAGVKRELGRPGQVIRLARGRGEVWSWLYPNNDCLLFEVSFDANGRVNGSGYGLERGCADGEGME